MFSTQSSNLSKIDDIWLEVVANVVDHLCERYLGVLHVFRVLGPEVHLQFVDLAAAQDPSFRLLLALSHFLFLLLNLQSQLRPLLVVLCLFLLQLVHRIEELGLRGILLYCAMHANPINPV